MSTLLDYLNALDKDAAAREAHATEANAAMTAFGLTDEEQAALLSGDKQQVADLLGISVEELPSYIMPPS